MFITGAHRLFKVCDFTLESNTTVAHVGRNVYIICTYYTMNVPIYIYIYIHVDMLYIIYVQYRYIALCTMRVFCKVYTLATHIRVIS